MSRPVWRSLGRSTHKQLLVIGGYAPGPDIEEEPTDRVVAHVHSDEAEVSFYRISEVEDSNLFELQPVNSTATVAFHAPFCHVGDDTGGSKAIHRVSALILYYFLVAGHVKELVRNKSDPTMFTRNFRDACLWVENGGERPILPPTRRSSGLITSPPLCNSVPVRPKRSSTVCTFSRPGKTNSDPLTQDTASMSQYNPEDTPAPPITRSATDSISVKIKRERDEDTPMRPKKHPRRTLSEQIVITKYQDSILSPKSPMPRSPAPERVNKALTDRIQHLKDENADLKDGISGLEGDKEDLQRKIAKDARINRALRLESEQMRQDLTAVMLRLTSLESEVAQIRAKPGRPEG
jgi:cell division protein FtsB